jgi:plasmid stabilization system protein ParE
MPPYFVQISTQALQDIEDTHDYIAYDLIEPATADKYIKGIYDAIKKLAVYGGGIAVSQRDYLKNRYGQTVRTIHYKKMAIVYTFENGVITVRRVMPGSMIF